jgi:DNA-binding LacI/PurR family transcriptional regulator
MFSDTQDYGGMIMLEGIRAVLGSQGYRLLLGCPPSYDREVVDQAEIDFLSGLGGNPDIAGAIVWDSGNPGCAAVYRELVENRFPLVFIDREPPYGVRADVVACNNRLAARNAVGHLLELGHRRIAMVVARDRASSVIDRIEGYRLSLWQAEIDHGDYRVEELRLPRNEDWNAQTERFLADLLKGPGAPTAIFAVNDTLALHLYEAARKLKIEVPERLSIVGFDWLLRWTPSGGDITTVAQPFDEIGRVAAQRVLDQIGAPASSPHRHVLLDAPLIVKNSTRAPNP